jgi:hypothetical protein
MKNERQKCKSVKKQNNSFIISVYKLKMKNRWLSPLAIVVSFASQVYCFLPREERSALHTLSSPLSLSTSTSVEQPCFWKPKAAGSKWQERIHIRDLNVGQKLSGHVVADLLEGKRFFKRALSLAFL